MLRRFGNIVDVVVTMARVLRVSTPRPIRTFSPKRRANAEQIDRLELPIPMAGGSRKFHRYELTTCVGCGRCVGGCPAGCIHLGNERVPGRRGSQVTSFSVDYGRCLMCGRCAEVCPTQCIVLDSPRDPSRYGQQGTIVDFSRLPIEVAWGPVALDRAAGGLQAIARVVQGRLERQGRRHDT